jgi:hypothetical protein
MMTPGHDGRRPVGSRTITMIVALTENGLTANQDSPHVDLPEHDFKSWIQNILITPRYLWPSKKVARRCGPLKLNNGCAKELSGRLTYEIQ